jgi:hypothetical protein
MIEKIFLTSIVVFLATLLIVKVVPDSDRLPTWVMGLVISLFFGSAAVGFISILFLIWA